MIFVFIKTLPSWKTDYEARKFVKLLIAKLNEHFCFFTARPWLSL